MPEDLRRQVPYIRRSLEALRIPILEAQGEDEADGKGRPASGSIRELVARAQTGLAQLFGGVTVADLARREVELYEQDCQMFYV